MKIYYLVRDISFFTEIGSPLHQKVPICVFHITHNRSHHHGLFVKQNCNHSNTEPSANINHTKICFWQSGTHKTLLTGKKRMEQHFRAECRNFISICRFVYKILSRIHRFVWESHNFCNISFMSKSWVDTPKKKKITRYL